MKWLAIAVEVIGGLCLLIVLLGALRGVLDVPRLTFIRKFDEATKYPYFGLALLGIGLLIGCGLIQRKLSGRSFEVCASDGTAPAGSQGRMEEREMQSSFRV